MKKLIYSQEDLDLILSLEIQEKEEQITQLTNNWNELRKHIVNYLEEWQNDEDEWIKGKCEMAIDILYDMEEIKEDNLKCIKSLKEQLDKMKKIKEKNNEC